MGKGTKRAVALLLGVALTSTHVVAYADGPTTYPACPKAPSKSETDGAHYAYLAGRHSFDEGDYATALTYFKDAYRRDCTKHELLPIIARAYELTQNRAEALLALETFMKRVPANDPNVDAVKKRIANLKAQSDTKPAPTAVAAPVTPPSPPPAAPPPTAPPTAESTPAPSAPGSTSPSPSPSPPDGSRKASIAPFFVIGAGVVAAGVGTVVFLGGSSKRDDATNRCPQKDDSGVRTCPPGVDSAAVTRDYDAATGQMTAGGVVIGVGAALAIGGVVWLVVDRVSSRASTASTRLLPLVGNHAGGVALTF